MKGKGGSPYQEYEDPNKDKKFVPPPKDMKKPGEPPIKKVDKFLIDANCMLHPQCFKILAENPHWNDIDKLQNKKASNYRGFFILSNH